MFEEEGWKLRKQDGNSFQMDTGSFMGIKSDQIIIQLKPYGKQLLITLNFQTGRSELRDGIDLKYETFDYFDIFTETIPDIINEELGIPTSFEKEREEEEERRKGNKVHKIERNIPQMLKDLTELYQQGILTKKEFQEKKKKLMDLL
ncbi:MAG TPA: SHOCT domain-containing protein [Candidatus Nanoarchaeia archaeon]|nr:SHOCT domain-containing protein [Candidatus Nanoarchaeia archaeon]